MAREPRTIVDEDGNIGVVASLEEVCMWILHTYPTYALGVDGPLKALVDAANVLDTQRMERLKMTTKAVK